MLEEARDTGKVVGDIAAQSSPDAIIERMKRARDATRAKRGKEGKPTDDLDVITDEAIERTVALQIAQLHGVGKRQSWKGILQATAQEIEDALKQLDAGKVGVGAVVLVTLGASAEAQAAELDARSPTKAGESSPALEQPFPSYMQGVDKQLEVSRRVSEVMIEDSPSDGLTTAVNESELDSIKSELGAVLDYYRGRSSTASDIDTLHLSKSLACADLSSAAQFQTFVNGYEPASVDFEFAYGDFGDVRVRVSTVNGSVWFQTPVTEEIIDHVYDVVRKVKGIP